MENTKKKYQWVPTRVHTRKIDRMVAHNVMEENFYILEGEVDIVVDNVVHHLTKGQFIHIEPKEVHYVINRSNAVMRMVSSLAPFQDSDKVEVENPKLD